MRSWRCSRRRENAVRRELAIALRARATWVVAALAAVLVGHGFVLAVDLFSAASRSALAGSLQARELDPLAGVVRPTLGGVDLALVLLGPVVAASVVSLEKERGTFGALCLQVGSTSTVLFRKALAATCATSLLLLPALGCFASYRLVGGHLDGVETAVATLGELLHVLLVVAVSMAAAAWTASFAQAATLAIAFSLTSWMIDAGEGFAALAWLGRAEGWSVERQLQVFQRGLVGLGPLGWLLVAIAAALGLAVVGARIDWSLRRRALASLPLAALAAVLLATFGHVRRAYDWTEERRASLPPAVVAELRAIPEPIALEVRLDRDDSRRRQLESDVASRLLLARPDAEIVFPLDGRTTATEGARDADYGRIVVRVGDRERETRSTSRRELVTLILEAAGAPAPSWTMPPYGGFPVVVDGGRRGAVLLAAYGGFPLALLATGLVLSRRRNGR
jgi:hypothetical protein